MLTAQFAKAFCPWKLLPCTAEISNDQNHCAMQRKSCYEKPGGKNQWTTIRL